MLERSWFHRNGLFYTILAFVLLVHLILLAIRMYREWKIADYQSPEKAQTGPPLRVKIISAPLNRQIVQSEDPKSESAPKETRFLSDKTRSFERESVARKVDVFKSNGGKGGSGQKKISLSDLGAFKTDHNPLKSTAHDSSDQKRGQSSTNDFVEKIPLGDVTYLNTVEYKYYGFYHRIRKKLEQFWGRSIQEKAQFFFKQGRRVASDENLITSVEVTLDTTGHIVGITVKGSSGVKELDDAALESFNQAGPFPNPPKDLVQNGEVKIEWGFVVKT
jgi:TonB family protein